MKVVWLTILLCTALRVTGHEYFFRPMPADYNNEIQQIDLLFQSADKVMWLGTDRGLYSFDGRKYKFFQRQDSVNRQVTAIAQSPEGHIWAGYEDGTIQITSFSGKGRMLVCDSLRDVRINKIVFLENQDVLLATYGNGLWLYRHNKWQKVVFETLSRVSDIYDALLVGKNDLWLGTDNGIYIYTAGPSPKLRHMGREQGLEDEIITKLALGNEGKILIGMYDYGAAVYDPATRDVRMLKSFSSLEGDVVSLVQGYGAEVWVASEKNIWTASGHINNHAIEFPLDLKSRIACVFFDVSGNLWLASGNRLYVANTQIQYIHPPTTGIQCVLSDEKYLWIGGMNGLFRTDREGNHAKAFLQQHHINVLSLYRDESGFLWVGTFGQGLYILDPLRNRVRHLTEKEFLSNNSILNIDGQGKRVWLATLGGITQVEWKNNPFEAKLNIAELQDQQQTPPGYVYDVFVSASGKVWFGTDGKGLLFLENGILQTFSVKLPATGDSTDQLKTVYSIAEDRQQRLWISTVHGLVFSIDSAGRILSSYTSPNGALSSVALTGNSELLMIREGNITIVSPDGQVSWQDETNGLTSFVPEINTASTASDGSVWIADTDAILHYFSYNPTYDRKVQMLFEDVRPGRLSVDDPVRIKPDSNYLDIHFTGISFQNPASVRYRYKLEGHDQDWIITQEGRAVYSRLSPGDYVFTLQGSLQDDFINATTITQKITVWPPFYQRWWFILGILVLAFYIIFSLIRTRIARLKRLHELEKEKTTLQLHAIQAQVNPHFLFNSFNTLASIIEEDQLAAVDYVDQLSSFFRGALMHRDDELITIAEEMEIVRNYMYILKKRYGDNVHLEESIQNNKGWVAPLCIQLLVENAIKHNTVSAERNLTIRITIDEGWLEVSNPIQPKFQGIGESTGFGLSSLVTRYTYLTPLKIQISTEGNRFAVESPIIYPDKAA